MTVPALRTSLLPLPLFALACAMPAGSVQEVDCEDLCRAAEECGDADLGPCIERCRTEFAHCLSSQGDLCLACRESCDAECEERGGPCHCLPPGTPGAPCETDRDCSPGTVCHEGAYCVGSGPLRVTLSFSVDSDFDLHLLTPDLNEISFSSRMVDGGNLDVDQCVQPCGIRDHVENIVFADQAPPGRYEAWVVNYNGRSAGEFAIDVVLRHGHQRFTGRLPAEANAMSKRFPFDVPEPLER